MTYATFTCQLRREFRSGTPAGLSVSGPGSLPGGGGCELSPSMHLNCIIMQTLPIDCQALSHAGL